MQNNNLNPQGDLLLGQPSDTISSLAWSPVPQGGGNTELIHLLVAGTWDGKLLSYRVKLSGQFEATETQAHDSPILDVAWALDGSKVFTAACDGTVKEWAFGGQQGRQVAAHNDGVKFVRHVQTAGGNFLVTGGWDNTLKWWNLQSAQPIDGCSLPGPAHCASFNQELGVVCTTNRRILIFDLRKGLQPLIDFESPLRYSTRSVGCFAQANGFYLGSIEGRVQIQFVNLNASTQADVTMVKDASGKDQSFSYKYHRDPASIASQPTVVHSVNCVAAFQDDIFITAGSEGQITWWNKAKRNKLEEFQRLPSPVTSVAFSPDSQLLAYSCGYDWQKGMEFHDTNTFPNTLLVHRVTDADITEKPPQRTGTRR